MNHRSSSVQSAASSLAAGRRVLLASLAVLALGACDLIPTEPPNFEETYVVQAPTLNLSAADLAPAEVGVNADSSAFLIVSDSTLLSASLGEICAACRTLHGTTVPKPAFTYTFSSTIPVSSQLIAASVAAGTIDLALANGLNFDPVRPSASARGSIVMTVRRGTTTVATFAVNGTTTAFPPGAVLGGAIPITPFNFNQSLTVDVTVTSPAGDPFVVDTARRLLAAAGPLRASISEVTVSVATQSFADTTSLDFTQTKVDPNDKLEGGAFRFNFVNPFAIGGSFSLRFFDAGSGAALFQKAVTLAPSATSSSRIALTRDEVTSLLGKQLTVIVDGTFNAPSGQLTLTPRQVLRFTSLLEIVVRPFGD